MRRVSTVVVAVATALLLSIFVSAGPITGGGGLPNVSHGSALTGSGTTGSPLDLRSCGSGQVLVSLGSGSGWGCGSASLAVPANHVIPVSTGTALGSSSITDDAASVVIANASRFSVAEANGNTFIGGTLTGSGAVVWRASETTWGNWTGSGSVILGDASADTLTVNATTTTNAPVTMNGSGSPVMAWFGPAVSAPASAILKVNDNASIAVHNVPFSTDGDTTLGDASGDKISINGNAYQAGTAPTISSCGTSPAVTTGTTAFTVTVGTGTVTSCTATFATACTNAPTCIVGSRSSTHQDYYFSSVSTTAITVTTQSGVGLAGDKFDILCWCH